MTISTTEVDAVAARSLTWRQSWGRALVLAVMLGLAWLFHGWTERQLGQAIERSGIAFVGVRALEAALAELQSFAVDIGPVGWHPLGWAQVLSEQASHLGTLLFITAALQSALLLWEALADSWLYLVLVLAVLLVAVLGTNSKWSGSSLAWRLVCLLVALRLAVPIYAALDLAAGTVVQARTAEAVQAFERNKPSRQLVAAGESLKSTGAHWLDQLREWRNQDPVKRIDDKVAALPVQPEPVRQASLTNAMVTLAGALAFQLLMLPLLTLGLIRAILNWGVAHQAVRG